MNNEGENIIEEYLTLVREKLPNSIADDVISELRSYMLESAREHGNGEINVQAAKKVVAQFGAPGEVANEYRYSMFPESIPDDAVPRQLAEKPQEIAEGEPSQPARQHLTPIPQEDPSVNYLSFFFTASLQTWIWILIVSLLTLVIGPIGSPLWTLLIPISQAVIVTCALFFHSNNLKWNRTVLWRRAYQEWSALQNFVTMPENSIPEMGVSLMRLDVFVTFIGFILFLVATILGNSPLFLLFSGIPVCILLGARIYYRTITFREDKDPIRNSRKQFVVNLALLVGLNGSLFWIFYDWGYYGSILSNLSPFFLPFIVGYGSIVLFNITTGFQYLWLKFQDEPKLVMKQKKEIQSDNEEQLLQRLPQSVGRLYTKMVFWIIIYNVPLIYLSSMNSGFGYRYYELTTSIMWLSLMIAGAGILLVLYFPYRRFFIKNLNAGAIFGQRTRAESIIDTIVSSFIALDFLVFIFSGGLQFLVSAYDTMYFRSFGAPWSFVLLMIELSTYNLAVASLIIRIIGNICEFKPSWKRRAVSMIETSGVLLIFTTTALVYAQYLKMIYIQGAYGYYNSPLILISMPIILFLAFQVGSSSMKDKAVKKKRNKIKEKSSKSDNVYSSIAN